MKDKKLVTLEEPEPKYFEDVKKGDELYSIVFGKGTVVMALEPEMRVDGFYAFQVKFGDSEFVHYTLDGYPNWCSKGGCIQTVFYPKDVDFGSMDFEPIEKVIKEKKVKKLKESDELEMRCPSGAWRNVNECPTDVVKRMLDTAKYHLFRKDRRKKNRKED